MPLGFSSLHVCHCNQCSSVILMVGHLIHHSRMSDQ
uniref:Uncharacterized protein n=1 Tax=Arundo donax TaxID=35708 RepID=A0A0A9CK39_ARUDO